MFLIPIFVCVFSAHTNSSIFLLDLDLNIPYIDSHVNDNEASNKGLIKGGTQHVSNNEGNEEERDKLIQGVLNFYFIFLTLICYFFLSIPMHVET